MSRPKLLAHLLFVLCLGCWCVSHAQPAGEPTVIKGGAQGWPVYLAFSPDDKELARINNWGHTLIDMRTRTNARMFDIGLRMVTYSPDGKTIVTAEGTDGARLWNAAAKGRLVPGTIDDLTSLTVLSDPKRVVITKAEAARQRVFAAGFTADGSRFFTTDAAGHVKIWRTATGALELDIAQTTSPVRSAAFHPNGKLIAFGDEAGVLRIWDLDGKKLVRELPSPAAIAQVEYSHDATRLLTVHARGIAMIWDPQTGKARVEEGVQAAAFSPDGKALALGGVGLRLIAPTKGDALRTIPLSGCPVTALAWRHDGKQLAVGCMRGEVQLLAMP